MHSTRLASFSNRIMNQSIIIHASNSIIVLIFSTTENLLHMLQLVAPKMTLRQMQNDEMRIGAMNTLLTQIHPSHFNSHEDAVNIYEDVQAFYDLCFTKMSEDTKSVSKRMNLILLGRNKKSKSPTTVVDLVAQFNVRQKWNWLDNYLRPLPPTALESGKVLAPLIAYQCINCRGAIAHGKRPSLIYSWENVQSCTGQSVMDILNKHGGYKSMTGGNVEEIKIEIIEHGPVISFSFIPSSAFALEHGKNIVRSRIKKHHYAMIVGWKLTEFGTVWLVQSYNGKTLMEVPVGHNSIDETILAPKDDYMNVTWQSGPYYDKDMSNFEGWLQSESISLILKSHDLEDLAEMFGNKSFDEVIRDRERFVIRDKKTNAHSRACVIERLNWESDIKAWKVICAFNDQGSSPLLDHNCSSSSS